MGPDTADALRRQKLDEIRDRLFRQPNREELEAMQLHLDALIKWDELMMMMPKATHHHHHHMEDHDDIDHKLRDDVAVPTEGA